MSNFNVEKIHDTVWVFHNALENSQEVIDYFNNNKIWSEWYTFGKIVGGTKNNLFFESFPTEQEWSEKLNQAYPYETTENLITKKIDSLFYETTKLYLEKNDIQLDNWLYQGWNVAKYIPNPSDHPGYVMHHHTDFQREKAYEPGIKFAVTAVFYLNDDYDGGEVQFRFVEDETLQIVTEDYTYKPVAGDVVVFLSGHPHYHGVKAISNGEKYIIRTYWKFEQEAHPKWLELEEKYGTETWKEMEKERYRFTYSGENQTIINNIPKFIGFEEYYNKLENGEI